MYRKYPRTYHLPWSPGLQNDDRVITLMADLIGHEGVVTEKMDGENTTGYSDGHIHARSLDTGYHASREWVKGYLAMPLLEIPKGWRLCGENLYAKHSIHYLNLPSYFLGFSLWNENNVCLSWDETIEWFSLLGVIPVRVIYRGILTETILREIKISDDCEGYVARRAESFSFDQFPTYVGKYVRRNHVQTSEHWMHAQMVKNGLANK